ncbi:MAG: hypothetical protein KDA71_12540 [Planctomycetales bacterium]|nr:hypothetical protein [Planctomycetales bacterium]MCA9224832.1 hypothetical protein [Planctomycetales bacterium]
MSRPFNDRFLVNTNRRVSAITTLSPMHWWPSFKLRVVFFLRQFGWFTENAESLKRLSFIHFARWVIIGRNSFPRLDRSQPMEDLKYDYLLFCSNFNGTWDQYIDAFSHAIPIGMDRAFGSSVKYPGSIPTTPFKHYIRANQLDTNYYYSAYPHATTNDVKRALDLAAKFQDFAARARTMTPTEFQEEYELFLYDVQNDLGASGP